MATWRIKGKHEKQRATQLLDKAGSERKAMVLAGEYAMAFGPGWTIWVEAPKSHGGGQWHRNALSQEEKAARKKRYELRHYVIALTPSGDTLRVCKMGGREWTPDHAEAMQYAGEMTEIWERAIRAGEIGGFEVVSEPVYQKNPIASGAAIKLPSKNRDELTYSAHGKELVVRKLQSGEYFAKIIGQQRARFGDAEQIREDVEHFLAYGSLPRSAGQSWF